MGIINLTFIINVMGSCFDEAYTRFLAKEEQDFKRRLECEMIGGRGEKNMAKGVLTTIKEEPAAELKKSPQKKVTSAISKTSFISLSKLVADLNFQLSQNILSKDGTDKLVKIMAQTKNLLDVHLAA